MNSGACGPPPPLPRTQHSTKPYVKTQALPLGQIQHNPTHRAYVETRTQYTPSSLSPTTTPHLHLPPQCNKIINPTQPTHPPRIRGNADAVHPVTFTSHHNAAQPSTQPNQPTEHTWKRGRSTPHHLYLPPQRNHQPNTTTNRPSIRGNADAVRPIIFVSTIPQHTPPHSSPTTTQHNHSNVPQ